MLPYQVRRLRRMFNGELGPGQSFARLIETGEDRSTESGDLRVTEGGGDFAHLEKTPDSLSGLVAWGEGSDLGDDGSVIASWLNKTGSGLDPAQGTAGLRPTVVANGINGQKAALFLGASKQYLGFAGSALGWFNNTPGATLAVVMRPVTSSATTQQIFISNGTTNNARASLSFLAASSYRSVVRRLDADAAGIITGSATVANGVPVIMTGSFDCVAGTVDNRVNGAVNGSGAMASSGGNFSATDSLSILLGTATPAGLCYDGYIAAYAMWNVPLTRAELDPILRRWARVYGITLLP